MRMSSCAAVVVLLAASCNGDSADQIRGTWLDSINGVYLELDSSGEFVAARNRDLADPLEIGTYSLDGERLTMTTAEASTSCPDTEATWTVMLSADGQNLNLALVKNSCSDDRPSRVALARQ